MRALRGGKKETGRTGRVAARVPAVLALLFAVFAAASLLGVDALVAEPYFSVRDGYKCSKCHVNKTGGNMRTDYAKVYMATRGSMGVELGDDEALSDVGHGRLSKSVSFNADVRQIADHRHFAGEENRWQFGRRSACETCHADTGGGGKLAEVYAQFEAIPGKASVVIAENLVPAPTTREAYGLLNVDTLNAYVKVGTFRMPTALRNTFDDPYVHGLVEQGNNTLVGQVPVQGDGVELGIEPGPYSVSLSVTNPPSLSDVPRGKRVHLNAYAVGDLGLLGVTWYEDPLSDTLERTYTAVYGGISIGRLTALLELDTFTDSNPEGGSEDLERESYLAEFDFLISRGQNLKLQYEAFEPDKATEKDISDRTSLIYEPFITPYLQFRGGARRWEGPRENAGYNGTSVFAEVHFTF